METFPGLDGIALALSIGCVAAYYGYLRWRLRGDPHYTVHAVNELARTRWVMAVMASDGMDVLAVQTLRNSVMASSFMASTSVLLMVGVLTLSGSAASDGMWHALNIGTTGPRLVTLKLILLLADFFLAFFCFSMAVRFFNHVGYMINVPAADAVAALAPARVADCINRAGRCYTMGTRAFFFCVPLVLWFFGPHFMLVATAVLLAGLYFLDRSPADAS